MQQTTNIGSVLISNVELQDVVDHGGQESTATNTTATTASISSVLNSNVELQNVDVRGGQESKATMQQTNNEYR